MFTVVGHMESSTCSLRQDEKDIPLSAGETFPPCVKAAELEAVSAALVNCIAEVKSEDDRYFLTILLKPLLLTEDGVKQITSG